MEHGINGVSLNFNGVLCMVRDFRFREKPLDE
ncbi:hypothetical protein NTGM5_130070 [Candidatus Nitrotoga sp. M5]|nr:hypothetical protein NTGM5_130070 [Candidatus Nitrotoga sp. M5]